MVTLDDALYDRELRKARERVPGIGIKKGSRYR